MWRHRSSRKLRMIVISWLSLLTEIFYSVVFVTTKNTKKTLPFPIYLFLYSFLACPFLLALEKCRWNKMTGYSPQFSNISAKSKDFFSGQTRSNMCIFWNFVIDFVLKEIKNAKNIIVWPFCVINLSNMLIIFNRYSGLIADLVLWVRHMSIDMWFWDVTIIPVRSISINS